MPSLIRHGADVNASDIRLQTPLHHACSYDPAITDSQNDDGLTWGVKNIMLLIRAGALISTKDQNGESPMDIASRLDFPEYCAACINESLRNLRIRETEPSNQSPNKESE